MINLYFSIILMKHIQNFYFSFDMLTATSQFQHKRTNRMANYLGSTLTLSAFLLTLYVMIQRIRDFIQVNNPVINNASVFDTKEYEVSLKSLYFFIQVRSLDIESGDSYVYSGDTIKKSQSPDPQSFSFVANARDSQFLNKTQMELCTVENMKMFEFPYSEYTTDSGQNLLIGTTYCLGQNFHGRTMKDSEKQKTPVLSININNLIESDARNDKLLYSIRFYYMQTVVIPKEYTNPIGYTWTYKDISVELNMSKKVFIKLQKLNVRATMQEYLLPRERAITQDTDFTYQEVDSLFTKRFNSNITFKKEQSSNLEIYLERQDYLQETYISYITFDNLIGDLFGYFQTALLIISFFFQVINSYYVKSDLLNNIFDFHFSEYDDDNGSGDDKKEGHKTISIQVKLPTVNMSEELLTKDRIEDRNLKKNAFDLNNNIEEESDELNNREGRNISIFNKRNARLVSAYYKRKTFMLNNLRNLQRVQTSTEEVDIDEESSINASFKQTEQTSKSKIVLIKNWIGNSSKSNENEGVDDIIKKLTPLEKDKSQNKTNTQSTTSNRRKCIKQYQKEHTIIECITKDLSDLKSKRKRVFISFMNLIVTDLKVFFNRDLSIKQKLIISGRELIDSRFSIETFYKLILEFDFIKRMLVEQEFFEFIGIPSLNVKSEVSLEKMETLIRGYEKINDQWGLVSLLEKLKNLDLNNKNHKMLLENYLDSLI